MKELELRRHAERERGADALSPRGRVQAEDLGRSLPASYDMVFVSPAKRAAETVAWMLRGSGHELPAHAVVPGLGSDREDEWRSTGAAVPSGRVDALMEVEPRLVAEEAERMAEVIRSMFEEIPELGRGLAVGHTPLIEVGVYGLAGLVIEPLAECEGVHISLVESGDYRIQELRVPSPGSPGG
jgi:broad specificity phosphatase PhoE